MLTLFFLLSLRRIQAVEVKSRISSSLMSVGLTSWEEPTDGDFNLLMNNAKDMELNYRIDKCRLD